MASASNQPGAVFLSYAREDATTARRIADALRAKRIEVWFDEEELRGGDQWDALIRRQIKECRLFVPVISSTTNGRREGYFRREWKLAVERTYDLDEALPFLLPVVLDSVNEAAAHVPDKFREVQWTPIPDDAAIGRFATRVASLLDPTAAPPARPLPREPHVNRSRAKIGWPAIAAALALVAVVIVWIYLPRPQPAPQVTALPTPAAQPAVSPGDRLLQQARDLLYDPEAGRSEFALAETLLKRAETLLPESADFWGLSALVNSQFVRRDFEPTEERKARARGDATKALRLQPDQVDALIALATSLVVAGDQTGAKDVLQKARQQHPREGRIHVELGQLLPVGPERIKFQIEHAPLVNDGRVLLYNASNQSRARRWWTLSRELSDRVLDPNFSRGFEARAITEYYATGDPAIVGAWLDKAPASKRQEPRAVLIRYQVAMVKRDGLAAEAAIRLIAADWIQDRTFSGPRAALIAQARELQGGLAAGQAHWKEAESLLRARLKDASTFGVRALLALSLAATGQHEEARSLLSGLTPQSGTSQSTAALAHAWLRTGNRDQALRALRDSLPSYSVTPATIKADPRWDPLRTHPDYPQLLQECTEADAKAAEALVQFRRTLSGQSELDGATSSRASLTR